MREIELQNIDSVNDYQSYRQTDEQQRLVDEFFSEMPQTAQIETKEEEKKELKPPKEMESTEGIFKRFTKDVTRGTLAEGPRAIASGVVEGINEMIQYGNDFNQAAGDLFAKGVLKTFGTEEQLAKAEKFISKRKAEEAKQPFEALPDIKFAGEEDPKTTTGNLIKGVSQWLTGFVAAGKILKGAKILQGTGKALKLTKTAIQGGLGDILAFDEQEKRLSDLIQSVPMLQNPVTEFLQSDPTDTKVEAKMKQFMEGVGLDAISEAFIGSLKMMRSFTKTKKAIINETVGEAPEAGLKASHLASIGDIDDPNLILKKAPLKTLKQAVKETEGITPEQITKIAPSSADEIQINFARIEGPDDIKNAMQAFANETRLLPKVQEARRGVRTNEVTLKAAEDIDGFKTLLDRRIGQPLNAEEITAARNFYYSTTDKLMELAQKAASPEATDADQFAFRKMITIHHATQKEVLGARAEAGRALQAWSIPATGTPAQKLKGMEEILDTFGGSDTSKDLAKRLASFGNKQLNTDQINTIVQKAASARTIDAMAEVWTLGLLTNPVTHTKNFLSNTATNLMLVGERYGQALFPNSNVTINEANAFARGYIATQKEAFANAAKAFRTGETGFGVGKIELPRVRATSKEVLDATGPFKPFGYAMDYYGRILNTAGKALAAGDEYSKTVLYKSQLHALATREAMNQGLKGDEFAKFVAQTVNAPSDKLVAAASDFANYGTFTKELGKSGKAMQRIISQNPILRFAIPFYRTPTNIFKFTFERTPLAPLSKTIRDEIAAGGARKAAALTKIGMGSSMLMLATDMSINGNITGAGPTDPDIRRALRRQGWQPHSIKIGNKYISYAGLEPFSTLFGLAADMSEILTNYEMYDIEQQEGVDKLASAAVLAISDATINKTFLSGVSNIMEAMAMPEMVAEKTVQRQLSSFVPSGVAAIERAINPQKEYVFNIRDAFKSRIPGVSDEVSKQRNVYGEIIQYRYPDENILDQTVGGVTSLFNPFYTSTQKDDPLDKFLLKEGLEVHMPNKILTIDETKIDMRDYPEMYSRFLELRGKEVELIQYGGVNMKQALTDLIQENTPRSIEFFSNWTTKDEQQDLISKTVRDYSEAAKKQLREEFPVIEQLIYEDQLKKEGEL